MVEYLKKAPRESRKWKSPGIDKVPNIWFNTFDSIHRNIIKCFNRAIKNPETNPKCFIQGIQTCYPNRMKVINPKTIDL